MSTLASTSLEMALEAYRAGNIGEAFALAEVGLNIDPNDPNLNQLSAVLMLQSGHVEAAVLRFEAAYRVAPDNADLILNYAQALITSGGLERAAAILAHGVSIAPSHAMLNLRAGEVAELLDDRDAAERFARAAMAHAPDNVDVVALLVRSLQARGAYDEAGVVLDEAAAHQPEQPQLLLVQAKQAMAQGDTAAAMAAFEKAIESGTNETTVFLLRGNFFLEANRFEDALRDYNEVIAREPSLASAHFNSGHAYLRLGKDEEAVQAYRRAYEADPSNIEALFNVGTIANSLSYFDIGIDVLSSLLEQDPGHHAARNNRAHAYRKLSQFQKALDDYQVLTELDPKNSKYYYNIGATFYEIKDFNQALSNIDKALGINPEYLDALVARGLALYELVRYSDALATFDEAIAISPNFGDARLNRGHLRRLTNDFLGAIEDYKIVIDNEYSYKYVLGDLLYCKMQICDWTGLDELYQKIENGIRDQKKVATPFALISYASSAEIQKSCAEIYCRSEFPPRTDIDPPEWPSPKDRIRVAYFSADFHDHATMHLMAGLFEEHDRSKFETYAFSFGPVRKDAMRARAELAFDHFIECSELSDKAIALFSRHLEIDIAIDLKGFTTHSRVGIFAYRAAPIQINYLGYPGTMGAQFIDYIIADNVVIPSVYEEYYTEKVVRLPLCYQPNDSKRKKLNRNIRRSELGIPDDAFVFCSFNNNFKITPKIFDLWCDILHEVDNSIIWLLADNKEAMVALKEYATRRGIDSSRLVFAPRVPSDVHLARHAAADLFLDCYPCCAHTTASDALFSGLPVLTLAGVPFASRVASSLLSAVGLDELITRSFQDYRQKAIELATERKKLDAAKQRLTSNIGRLYETRHFAVYFYQQLEAIYLNMREN